MVMVLIFEIETVSPNLMMTSCGNRPVVAQKVPSLLHTHARTMRVFPPTSSER